MPDRLSQSEEERFQQGRRDAYQDIDDAAKREDPFYADGWREGMLEKLEQMIRERNKEKM